MGHTPNRQRSLLSSGERGFGEAMHLGNAPRETPMGCSAKGRLSRGSSLLQHPLQTPCISPQHRPRAATLAQLGGVPQAGFFPPVLCLSGPLQHTVKPFIDKEGKGFTTVFKASPGSKENLPRHTQFGAAHVISGSLRTPREQQQRPAASPHLQLMELASCPNPSSHPCSHMSLGHSMFRNSLSAKRQRQLLQKQNKIEYNEEQRVCRTNCCSGKTPKLATSSPYRQHPRPPSQLPCHRIMDFLLQRSRSQEHSKDNCAACLGRAKHRRGGSSSAGM